MNSVIKAFKSKNVLFSAAGSGFVLSFLLLLCFAFAACGGNANLPYGTEELTSDTVKSIAGAKSLFIPASVKYVEPEAWYKMAKLEAVTVSPDNPNYSSEDGMLFNKAKTELRACPRKKAGVCNVPEGVTDIGSDAFEGCESITAVNIPASVKFIGVYSFDGCIGLAHINVNADNENYSSADGVLLTKDKTELVRCPIGKVGAYAVPSGVRFIAGRAFAGCTKLTAAVLPETATLIGEEAFSKCTGLTGTFEIPVSVSVIEKNAFDGCSASLTVMQGNKAVSFKPAED